MRDRPDQSRELLLSSSPTPKLKFIIYVTSLCSTASLVGIIGTYAILKKPISQQLHLKQSFLGLLDSLSFVGRILGYLFMTFYPTTTPKRDFFKSSVVSSIFLALIPLSSQFPSCCHLMLTVGMLFSGFSRAYVVVPNMIMLQHFDAKNHSDRIFINFWAALGTMGDVLAILLTSLLISIGVTWQICFFISIAIFFICSSLLVLIATELNLDQSHAFQDQKEGKTPNSSMRQNLATVVAFYTKKQNLFWMFEYALISIMYYNILMWFPYYFTRLGFSFQASIISVMYPTFALFSVGIFEFCLRKFKVGSDHLISLLHGLNTCIYLAMLITDSHKTKAYLYIIEVAASGAAQGGPYSSVTSSELRLRANGNREMMLALTTCKLTFQVFTVLAMYFIGWLIQINIKFFLLLIFGNAVSTFVIHLFRIAKYGSIFTAIQHNQQNDDRKQDSLQTKGQTPIFQSQLEMQEVKRVKQPVLA